MKHGGAMCSVCEEPTWFDVCGCGSGDLARMLRLEKKLRAVVLEMRGLLAKLEEERKKAEQSGQERR